MSPSVPSPAVKLDESARTALVVDDVDDMLDLLEIALKRADFVVLRASSAGEALRLFEKRGQDIDLLMTEVRLGSESGIDLARRLLTVKPSLQVLVTSGFVNDRRVVKSETGVAFLPKPFSSSELRKKLDSMFPAARAS